mmetsp:Transcript_34092/g.76754  ORF Transcript_34092/g.76754 Transcript_34092/m.76754 type:complete len:236 (+) Transcript_34092:1164-1871(+)
MVACSVPISSSCRHRSLTSSSYVTPCAQDTTSTSVAPLACSSSASADFFCWIMLERTRSVGSSSCLSPTAACLLMTSQIVSTQPSSRSSVQTSSLLVMSVRERRRRLAWTSRSSGGDPGPFPRCFRACTNSLTPPSDLTATWRRSSGERGFSPSSPFFRIFSCNTFCKVSSKPLNAGSLLIASSNFFGSLSTISDCSLFQVSLSFKTLSSAGSLSRRSTCSLCSPISSRCLSIVC